MNTFRGVVEVNPVIKCFVDWKVFKYCQQKRLCDSTIEQVFTNYHTYLQKLLIGKNSVVVGIIVVVVKIVVVVFVVVAVSSSAAVVDIVCVVVVVDDDDWNAAITSGRNKQRTS